MFRVSCFRFQVSGFRLRVSGFVFRVPDFGFRVSGFWFLVSSFEVRAWGFTAWCSSRSASPLKLEQRRLPREPKAGNNAIKVQHKHQAMFVVCEQGRGGDQVALDEFGHEVYYT